MVACGLRDGAERRRRPSATHRGSFRIDAPAVSPRARRCATPRAGSRRVWRAPRGWARAPAVDRRGGGRRPRARPPIGRSGAGAAGSGHDSGGRAAANAHGKDIGVGIPRALQPLDQGWTRARARRPAPRRRRRGRGRPLRSRRAPRRACRRARPRTPRGRASSSSGMTRRLAGDAVRGKRADADEGSARPNAADFNFAAASRRDRRVTFHNADNFYHRRARARRRRGRRVSARRRDRRARRRRGPPYGKYKKRGRGGKGDPSAREATVTVVGHIPGAAEGTNLLMTGDWRDVEKWGTQFVLNCAPEEVAPADEDAMLRYLAGGALPGVGKATAAKLVAHFGVDVFAAFDAPDAERRLRECPGVGAKTAAKLAGAWGDSRGRRDAALFLEKHGDRAGARAAGRRRARRRDPGARARRPLRRARRDPRRDVPPVRARSRRGWARRRTPRPGWRRPCCACCSRRRCATGTSAAACETGGRRRQAGGPAAVPEPLGGARSRRRRTCFCAAGTSPWRRIPV